jgi:hypothetical protein
MWGKRFWLRATGAICFAVVLTSAAMYWIQYLHIRIYDATYIPDYSTTYTPDYFSTYTPDYSTPIADALKRLSPADERAFLERIEVELKEKPVAELYRLKAFDDDLCKNGTIDCRGIDNKKVQRFVDAVLADRATTATLDSVIAAHHANYISAGSLFIAFLALIFTTLTYVRKSSPT